MKLKLKANKMCAVLILMLMFTFNPSTAYGKELKKDNLQQSNLNCINLDWAQLSWDNLDWNSLDYGIYWYGLGNKPYKFVPNVANPAYDPLKPTIIYIHGWQPEYSLIKHRESFYFYGQYAADPWIKAGWNVGVFYWNQFSDEFNVEDAEAKIWTATSEKGMRWRKGDGTYDTSNSIKKNAAELLYEEYIKALSGYKGNDIRIAGHSLGSQMAIRLTKLISDNVDSGKIAPELLPSRVALLDPYFSNLGKYYLNNSWTGEVARNNVASLINDKNIPFEFYKSSALTSGLIGDDNLKLKKLCAYTELKPLFYVEAQQIEKHYHGKYNYFCSYAVAPPPEYIGLIPSGNIAASSKTTTIRIAEMMGQKYYWEQLAGKYTEASGDDTYRRCTRLLDTTSVTELTLDKYNFNVKVGQYVSVKALINPLNATNKIVIWTSSNENIAKVFVNGEIKGIGPGTAIITCTTADGKLQKTCTVNVTD